MAQAAAVEFGFKGLGGQGCRCWGLFRVFVGFCLRLGATEGGGGQGGGGGSSF